jgi:hypothetical protein
MYSGLEVTLSHHRVSKTLMRVLIISPHFPPTNAADMQRVRLILPYLAEAGASVEVLSVEAAQVAAPQDAWLAAGLPLGIPIHRVTALGLEWSRVPGLGTLSYRALRAIRRKGSELLGRNQSSSSFDLVYFSTTQFGIHVLGPEWKKKFGVPFLMDYQDPWVSDYYREHLDVVPPGGRLKYGLASWMSRRLEPRVLRHCSGITSVSAAYPEQLARRYGGEEMRIREKEGGKDKNTAIGQSSKEIKLFQFSAFRSRLFSSVLPFPGDVRDFERVKRDDIHQAVFDPHDGLKHWVYVGRGGADMALAGRAVFSALAGLRHLNSDLRLHFIGTSYAAAGRGVKTIEPLATEYGLEGIVMEHPDRIPYSETLRCLLDADALVVPGSDDPGYTASKIYPYLLAEKPLLAVFHEQSSVVELIRQVGGGVVVGFDSGDSPEAIAKRIRERAFDAVGHLRQVVLDREAFASHTAVHQAIQLVDFFRVCLGDFPAKSTVYAS